MEENVSPFEFHCCDVKAVNGNVDSPRIMSINAHKRSFYAVVSGRLVTCYCWLLFYYYYYFCSYGHVELETSNAIFQR